MVQSKASTVAQYLAELPAERREALEAVRQVILDNVDDGIVEGMQYGMIGYHVPHSRYPDGYHCDPKQPLPYAALASQKNYMAVYLFGCYVDGDDARWLEQAWRAAGKKLDMGKSCIRFKSLDAVPLDVLAEVFRRMPSERFIGIYEGYRNGAQKPAAGPAIKKAATKKAATKKSATKKSATKKKATKKAAKK